MTETRPPVTVAVSTCLGVQSSSDGASLALVFQRPCGGLHVVAMPAATALAAAFAIRNDIHAPPTAAETGDQPHDDHA